MAECDKISECLFFTKFGNHDDDWYLNYCGNLEKSNHCIRKRHCQKMIERGFKSKLPPNITPNGIKI